MTTPPNLQTAPLALYQCIPNFSEGRRPETVAALVAVAGQIAGAQVIDWSMDPDHNRSVITLLGGAEPIRDAVLAMANIAVASIDLRIHSGLHPRTGAIDVIPIVPILNASRGDADRLAHRIGVSLARQLYIPVYYYEWSAAPGRLQALPEVRGLLKLADRDELVQLIGESAPDEGPNTPHQTAGIAVVGARAPLAAYNIDLFSSNIREARLIANEIRTLRSTVSYLDGVRALGLYLPTRKRAQVSMNLTKPENSPLPAVWEFVREHARNLGIDAAESEIIGVVPSLWLGGASPEDINWAGFSRTKLLETWLEATIPSGHS